MDLVHLIIALGTFAPLANYVGYDSSGRISRYVSLTICRTVEFTANIQTNGVFTLQVAHTINGGWEAFGNPIIGPSESVHTLPVPSGDTYFRLKQIQ